MPKGYVIAQITVIDPERYREYVRLDTPVVARFGGRFLVRGGRSAALEGDILDRHVVIEFPDYDTALAFYHSDEYQRAAEIRRESAESRMLVVAGAE